MTMPAGWTATPIGANEIDLLINLLGTSNPDLANLVRNILDLTGARPSMVGGDLRDLSVGVPPNVTVIIQPTGGPVDLVGTIVEQLIKRIPGVVGNTVREKLTLPSGDAIRITYQVQPGGGALTSLRTFVIVRGTQTFLVTFSASADRFPELESTFNGMIDSLRF
jgi:hypothetical protein